MLPEQIFFPPDGDFIAFPRELYTSEQPEDLRDECLAPEPPGTRHWARAIAAGPDNPGGQLCLQ